MKTVGLRELKNRLSEYIREVRSGEAVLVTDRGEVVAEILPPRRSKNEPELRSTLEALARRGVLTPGKPNDPSLYRKMPRALKTMTSKQLLDEDRGDR